MKALFFKDLKRSSILFVLFVVMTFLFTQLIPRDGEFYDSAYAALSVVRLNAMMIVMAVYGSLMHNEKYEEKYRAYEMMKILPLTGKEIATAKFAVYAVWGICSAIYTALAVPVLFPGIADKALLRSQLVLTSGVSLAAAGIIYASIARLSYRKVKAWIMLVYIALLMGPSVSSFVRLVTIGDEAVQTVVERYRQLPLLVIFAVSILVFVGAWFVAASERPEGNAA